LYPGKELKRKTILKKEKQFLKGKNITVELPKTGVEIVS